MAVEGHGKLHIQSLDFPGVALDQPIVGHLDLLALVDHLLEHAVGVSEAITPRREIEGCQ